MNRIKYFLFNRVFFICLFFIFFACFLIISFPVDTYAQETGTNDSGGIDNGETGGEGNLFNLIFSPDINEMGFYMLYFKPAPGSAMTENVTLLYYLYGIKLSALSLPVYRNFCLFWDWGVDILFLVSTRNYVGNYNDINLGLDYFSQFGIKYWFFQSQTKMMSIYIASTNRMHQFFPFNTDELTEIYTPLLGFMGFKIGFELYISNFSFEISIGYSRKDFYAWVNDFLGVDNWFDMEQFFTLYLNLGLWIY